MTRGYITLGCQIWAKLWLNLSTSDQMGQIWLLELKCTENDLKNTQIFSIWSDWGSCWATTLAQRGTNLWLFKISFHFESHRFDVNLTQLLTKSDIPALPGVPMRVRFSTTFLSVTQSIAELTLTLILFTSVTKSANISRVAELTLTQTLFTSVTKSANISRMATSLCFCL